jgi:hypothetical protein
MYQLIETAEESDMWAENCYKPSESISKDKSVEYLKCGMDSSGLG